MTHSRTERAKILRLTAPFRAAGLHILKSIVDVVDIRLTVVSDPDPSSPLPTDNLGFLDILSEDHRALKWVSPTHPSFYFNSLVLPAIMQRAQLDRGDCTGYQLRGGDREIERALMSLHDNFQHSSGREFLLVVPGYKTENAIECTGYSMDEDSLIEPKSTFSLAQVRAEPDDRYCINELQYMLRTP